MRTKILYGVGGCLVVGILFWLLLFSNVFSSSVGPLKTLYPGDIKQIDKILLINGGTGKETIISDKGKIQKWVSSVQDVKFILDSNQEPRAGYAFSYHLYEDGHEIFTFTSNKINGEYYRSTTGLGAATRELTGER